MIFERFKIKDFSDSCVILNDLQCAEDNNTNDEMFEIDNDEESNKK